VRRNIATLACGTLALALAASAEEQGRVLVIRAHGDDGTSAVEIEGDRPLSFTTMKLLAPPRVVVDFADAAIAAEERELEIEDGTLRRAAIGQAGAKTARVVIELAVDAEFDVRADGNRVEVRVPRPGSVATAQPDGGDAEAQKVASLPTVSLVGSKPAQPPEDARPRSAAEKAEALKKALAEQRRRAAEEKAARKLQKKNGRKVATMQPASPPSAALEPAPQPASSVPDSRPHDAADERGKDAAGERAQTTAEPAVTRAAGPAVRRAASDREEPATPVAAARGHRITGIGFRPVRGGEVIVRSDQPLEYGVSEGGDALLLHLPSAAIPLPNNRRPLDTRFFSGAVQRVVPVAVPGGTDVRIELRERAEYQLAQTGSVLTVTFSAPQ
jgi:hypothetical protein